MVFISFKIMVSCHVRGLEHSEHHAGQFRESESLFFEVVPLKGVEHFDFGSIALMFDRGHKLIGV
jgi:hypothetical protein